MDNHINLDESCCTPNNILIKYCDIGYISPLNSGLVFGIITMKTKKIIKP